MPLLLSLYQMVLRAGEPLLRLILARRLKKGKEDPLRIAERRGDITKRRPEGLLLWVHAASVGESQSALILIDHLLSVLPTAHILVTTGTVTSAQLMAQRLPPQAFHQYIPVDHPDWVESFFDHWTPDMAFWMESELWPNILMQIQEREIPAVLVNARLSDKSFQTWKKFPKTIQTLLGTFKAVLAQSDADGERYTKLGAHGVVVTDNIKYSAPLLPCDPVSLGGLRHAVDGRTLLLYASTHAGEESMAGRIHTSLKTDIPDLLTIIVPRHPARRDDIAKELSAQNLKFTFRSNNIALPHQDDDIYVADTMGELGLFYTLCPMAVIGRSFSSDGGGGHNPIEAAQLGCVVLTGPNNQFQRPLYDAMAEHHAVIEALDEESLTIALQTLINRPQKYNMLKEKIKEFVDAKTHVIDRVMETLMPLLKKLDTTQ